MRMKTFPIVLLLSAITIVACGPEFIDQHERIKITSDSDIHSGPGQEYNTIATVKAGSELILLESENDWHKVRLSSGRTGWIFRGVTQTIGPEKVVMIQDARIRRGPGEEYKPFAIAKKGRTLDARGQRGNWYLIDLPNGQSGWVSKQDVKKEAYLNLTPTQKTKVYQLPNPNSAVLLSVDPGTEMIQLQQEGDYYMVRLPGGDTGWIQKDSTNPIKERNLIVKERASIKYGPSIQYENVETVEKGTRLTVLTQKDDWYQVRTPEGRTGWVYKDFIVQSTTVQDVAIDEVPLYFITNTDCNIRQGDGTNYPLLARVKKGTILVKVGQKSDWYKIRMADQSIGWIQEDLVDYNPTILITLDQCNIRLGPSTDFRVKTTVSKGTPLAKITEKDGWSQIYLPDGEIGWIRNDLRADTEKTLFVKEDCNVRDGPEIKYQQIDRLKAGTPVIKIDKQGEWYQVQLPSKRMGWIRQDLLRESPNQMVTNDRVNLRMGPGTIYQIITQLEKNTPITVIEEQEDWYKVKLSNGTTGWIRKDMVSFSYYPQTSEAMPANDSYQSYDVPSTPSPVAPYTYQPVTKPEVTSSPKKVTITTTSAVNLRLGPSTDETVIKLLPAGTRVTRIDLRGEWYEIQTTDGVLGWGHESGFAAGDNKLYTLKSCNIRLGPSTNYRIITTLPEKTELKKIEQRDDWFNVQLANGEKGWIQKDLVTGSKVPAPLLPQKTEAVSGTLITTSEAKILQGPDDKFPTVKLVNINTELTSISQYQDWYEVETFDGEKGWILAKNVREKENKKIIVTQKTEVRQEANAQSAIISIVDGGEFYPPLSQVGGWYRIPIKPGITGYISSQDVLDLKYPEVYVNTSSADIMKFPDEKSSRLAVVKEGIQLLPMDENDEWLFVELPRGDKGWIKKRQVNRQKYPQIKIVKDTEAYEQPTAGSLLKATLIKDDEFLALDLKNNWYKILLRGSVIGWIYSGYAKEITKGSLLIRENSFLRMGPGLDYRTLISVPGGAKVKWLDQKGDWNQVQVASGEIGWIYEQLAKNVTMPEMTAQQNSPVYAGPGTNFAKVGEVIRGKKYAPIEKKPDWYQIELITGTSGWVPMEVFSTKKSSVVFTLDKANIRSGPGEQYNVVQTLQPAVDVTVLRTEGSWYYIQLQDGKRGYIRKDLVFEE